MTDRKREIGELWYDDCMYCIMTKDGVKRYDSEQERREDNPNIDKGEKDESTK
jgi:hypothetical protein